MPPHLKEFCIAQTFEIHFFETKPFLKLSSSIDLRDMTLNCNPKSDRQFHGHFEILIVRYSTCGHIGRLQTWHQYFCAVNALATYFVKQLFVSAAQPTGASRWHICSLGKLQGHVASVCLKQSNVNTAVSVTVKLWCTKSQTHCEANTSWL